MEFPYVVRECSRPYGTPPRYGIFRFAIDYGASEPLRWSEDKVEMETVCEQMNTEE